MLRCDAAPFLPPTAVCNKLGPAVLQLLGSWILQSHLLV